MPDRERELTFRDGLFLLSKLCSKRREKHARGRSTTAAGQRRFHGTPRPLVYVGNGSHMSISGFPGLLGPCLCLMVRDMDHAGRWTCIQPWRLPYAAQHIQSRIWVGQRQRSGALLAEESEDGCCGYSTTTTTQQGARERETTLGI